MGTLWGQNGWNHRCVGATFYHSCVNTGGKGGGGISVAVGCRAGVQYGLRRCDFWLK